MLYTTALNQFPTVRNVNPKHWDFIVTVASVFIAATQLSTMRLGEARTEALMNRVEDRLNRYSKDGVRAFEDCKQLFERNFDALTAAGGHDPKFIGSDSLGTWIAWNTIGQSGSEEERRFIRVVGGMVTGTFFNWWQ